MKLQKNCYKLVVLSFPNFIFHNSKLFKLLNVKGKKAEKRYTDSSLDVVVFTFNGIQYEINAECCHSSDK